MNYHKTAVLGWILGGLLLTACAATQIPFSLPSVRVPSLPSMPTLTVPNVSAPGISLPSVNAPAVESTLVSGVMGTPAPTTTGILAVPVTGSSIAGQVLKWMIYGLLLVAGIVLVVAMFRRGMSRTDQPGEPPDRPNI